MLSFLFVTKGQPYAERFIEVARNVANQCQNAEVVIALDRERYTPIARFADFCGLVKSAGYLESVLDEAVEMCRGDYVLRLDDDEMPSAAMAQWLIDEKYLETQSWAFHRANLWGSEETYITNHPLWPDIQTRLAIKEKSGGRKEIHIGSPHPGRNAPCMIEHHKFLIKNYAERKRIAEGYEKIKTGAGLSDTYKPFSLPEDCLAEINLAKLRGGYV